MAVSAAGCSKSGQTSTEGGSASDRGRFQRGAEAGGSAGGSGEYKDTLVWAQGADVTPLDPPSGRKRGDAGRKRLRTRIFDTLTGC